VQSDVQVIDACLVWVFIIVVACWWNIAHISITIVAILCLRSLMRSCRSVGGWWGGCVSMEWSASVSMELGRGVWFV